LDEQRDAIAAYAQRHDLSIIRWFKETQTAATQGRQAFGQLLNELSKGNARGVVIHKIDRSARNLKDWANLGDLIDRGVEIHFAHESIDLTSRGGRLAADIQAIVAADFIRNLREETRKGFYGRLKQGLYPLRAPLGYLDMGRGQAKAVDPIAAPLVRLAFELYSSGEFSFADLRAELTARGLRNKRGRPITDNGLTTILNNPFYIGLIHIRKTDETFQGAHPPIIEKRLYDEVQAVLRGRRVPTSATHDLFARRLIRCAACKAHLIGELQKQRYVYYRCHTKSCGAILTGRAVLLAVEEALSPFQFTVKEIRDFRDLLVGLRKTGEESNARARRVLELRIREVEERLARLTDAYIDQTIEKELFEDRKRALLETRRDHQDKLDALQSDTVITDAVAADLELMITAYSLFKAGNDAEKRAMLISITSNLVCSGRNLAITLKSPFLEIAKARNPHDCDPHREKPRNQAEQIFNLLLDANIKAPGLRAIQDMKSLKSLRP